MLNLAQEQTDADDTASLRGAYNSAGLELSAVTNKIKLGFSQFVKLMGGKDIDKILRNKEPKSKEEEIIVSGKLLTEITTAPLSAQRKSRNLLSGVFIIGVLLGGCCSVFFLLLLQKGQIEITPTLLSYMGIGFFSALVLMVGVPLFLAALEPYLKKIQEKHHDFVERLMTLFQ